MFVSSTKENLHKIMENNNHSPSTYVHPLRNVKFIYRILCFSVKFESKDGKDTNDVIYPNTTLLGRNKGSASRMYLTPRNYLTGYRRLHSLRMVSLQFEEVIVYNLKHLWRRGFEYYEERTLVMFSLEYVQECEKFKKQCEKEADDREKQQKQRDSSFNREEFMSTFNECVSAEYRQYLNNSIPFPYSFHDDRKEFEDMVSLQNFKDGTRGGRSDAGSSICTLLGVDRRITGECSRCLDQEFIHPLHYLAMDLLTLVAMDMETPLSLESVNHPHRFVLLDFLVLHLGVDISYYAVAVIMTFAAAFSDVRKKYLPRNIVKAMKIEESVDAAHAARHDRENEETVKIRKTRLMDVLFYIVKKYNISINAFPYGTMILPRDATHGTCFSSGIKCGHVLFKTLTEKSIEGYDSNSAFLLKKLLEKFPEKDITVDDDSNDEKKSVDESIPAIDLRCRHFNIVDFMDRTYDPRNIVACKTLLHLSIASLEKSKLIAEHDIKWTAIRRKNKNYRLLLKEQQKNKKEEAELETNEQQQQVCDDDDTSDDSLLLFTEAHATFVPNLPIMECVSQVYDNRFDSSDNGFLLVVEYLASAMRKFPKQLERFFSLPSSRANIGMAHEVFPLGLLNHEYFIPHGASTSPWDLVMSSKHHELWNIQKNCPKISAVRTSYTDAIFASNRRIESIAVRRVLKLLSGLRAWSTLDRCEREFQSRESSSSIETAHQIHVHHDTINGQFPYAVRERLVSVFRILMYDAKTRIINAWEFEHRMVDYGWAPGKDSHAKKKSTERFFLDNCLLAFPDLRLEFDKCAAFARNGFVEEGVLLASSNSNKSSSSSASSLMIVPSSNSGCSISRTYIEEQKIQASKKINSSSLLKPPRPAMPSLKQEQQRQEADKMFWEVKMKKFQQVRRPNSRSSSTNNRNEKKLPPVNFSGSSPPRQHQLPSSASPKNRSPVLSSSPAPEKNQKVVVSSLPDLLSVQKIGIVKREK